jgi:hypothetical protein
MRPHPQRAAIHSRKSASLTAPLATPRITWSVSSGSPEAGIQVRPLRSTNSTVARNAHRLLPSGSGWFLTRCQHKDGRFGLEVRVRLHATESRLRRGQGGGGESDAVEVGNRLGR